MKYYIYHILGFKIGATHDWKKRTIRNKSNYPNSEMVLLETIEDDYNIEAWQRVGDREWELADEYGYPRGTHYKMMVLKASKGGIVAGRLQSESGFLQSLNANRTQESRDNAAVSISIALKQKYLDGYISPKTGIPIKNKPNNKYHKLLEISQTKKKQRYLISIFHINTVMVILLKSMVYIGEHLKK